MKTHIFYIANVLMLQMLFSTVKATELYRPSIGLGRKSVVVVHPLDKTDTVYVVDRQVNSGTADAVVTEEYIDAMGHSCVTVIYNGSSAGKHLLTLSECDATGHVYREWLPVVEENYVPGGGYVAHAPVLPNRPWEALSQDDLKAKARAHYADLRPFAERTLEVGTGRITEERVQGASYEMHPSSFQYGVNGLGEVRHWYVTNNGVSTIGVWPSGSLRKTTYTDPDGNTISAYKNMQDQIVLRRTQDGDTYYIYDSFDRLCYILPPAAVAEMADAQYDDSSEWLQLYAYVYKYDRKGNMREKRLPGCEPVFMEYDEQNRLQYVQDGNQRQRGDYWLCMEYDSYGRMSREKEINRTNTSYEKPLKEFYYDDYSFLSSLPSSLAGALTFVTRAGYAQRSLSVSGLPTAEVTYSLNSSAKRIDVMYYDQMGRCIQKRTSDPVAGLLAQFLSYNFNGTINKLQIEHLDLTEKYTYQYDNLGRLTRTYYKFDGEASVLLSENVYDEVGRVTEYRRNNGQLIRRDSLDIRGNLGRRSDGDFVERLYYADNLPAGITPHYNGLISGSQQKQPGHDLLWKYKYDGSNRLIDAKVGTKEDGYSWREQFSYDAMGNVDHLTRTLEEEPIDDLNYRYRGNQLVDIEDNAGRIDYYNIKEYADLSAADTTMRYDANGNLKYDLDRGISYISYNLLNLPDTVQFSNGNMLIQEYDADGRKTATHKVVMAQPLMVPVGIIINLRQEDYSLRTTYYADNAEIAEPTPGAIEFTFHNAEGYVKYKPGDGRYMMGYYVRDHLGNICAVWDTEELQYTQRMWYYPSGVPMSISTGQSVQPMKYNGKPYEEMEGFDVFDYGFRGYYATIMRFTSIDPLAEETPWQSPYVYAANNPICNIDWMGLGVMNMNSNKTGSHNYVVMDDNGKVLDVIVNNDRGIYLADGNWEKGDPIDDLEQVGCMLGTYRDYINYMIAGCPAIGLFYDNLREASLSAKAAFGIAVNGWNFGSLLVYSVKASIEDGIETRSIDDGLFFTTGISFICISYERSAEYYIDSNHPNFDNNLTIGIIGKHISFEVDSSGTVSLSISFSHIFSLDCTIKLNLFYNQAK